MLIAEAPCCCQCAVLFLCGSAELQHPPHFHLSMGFIKEVELGSGRQGDETVGHINEAVAENAIGPQKSVPT